MRFPGGSERRTEPGQLELEVQAGEMPKVFASIDTDGSGTIALDEFVACKSAQPAQSDWSVWLLT